MEDGYVISVKPSGTIAGETFIRSRAFAFRLPIIKLYYAIVKIAGASRLIRSGDEPRVANSATTRSSIAFTDEHV